MIFDQLANIATYKGMHPHLDVAIEFYERTDLTQLQLGRHEIDADNVFLFVQENQLNQSPTDVFEFHKDYMDIQFIQAGLEIIRYGRQTKEVVADYVPDIGFVTCQHSYDMDLDGTNFTAFFPNEPHQSSQYHAGHDWVRKYVFKVKW